MVQCLYCMTTAKVDANAGSKLGLHVCATKEPFREASCILTGEVEAICVRGSLGVNT